MAHDEHFLQRLDRVTREHVEVALGLYRDHEAVRSLLRANGVTADGERVAIALADGGKGPHVIVAADGAFVTCLGEGMSTGAWRIIARAKVDGLLKKMTDQRHRRAVATQIARPGEDDNDLFARIALRKNRLSREELVGISAFAPLFAGEVYMLAADAVLRIFEGAQAKLPFKKGFKAAQLSDLHARIVWSAAYGVELCGLAGRDALERIIAIVEPVTTFSMFTTLLADHTFVMRGIWAAGKIGKPLIPSYRKKLETAEATVHAIDAALGLTTIALRHSHTTPDVLRLFRKLVDAPKDSPEATMRATAARLGTNVIENREELEESSLMFGAGAHARATIERLAEGDPDRIMRPEDVSVELAQTALLNTNGVYTDGGDGAIHLFMACPVLASVSAEAFHYPATLVRKLVTPWNADDAARHNAQMRTLAQRAEPLKYVARFGRNDPCPCGSGKKFKKCCLES